MKHYTTKFMMAFDLLIALAGCSRDTDTPYHARSLKIDSRYNREIVFEAIGVTIPIKKENVFIRVDGPVADVDKHQSALFQELGVESNKTVYTNPALNGRCTHLIFADGKECSFIWALKHPDDRITAIRIEHEKYHSLCRISPKDVTALSERIRLHGFEVDLRDYDEELSATVIEILSLHLLGIPLAQIKGSELTEQARDILIASYVEPVAPADADKSRR